MNDKSITTKHTLNQIGTSKQIRLSPKRGGHGHVTSYSVNLGSAEVRLCGFLDKEGNPLQLEKVVDHDNGQIIIRVKK